MNEVCNSCGSPNEVRECQFCPTLICSRCRFNHERVCEENQKRKQRGQGPTIRDSRALAKVSVSETLAPPEGMEAIPSIEDKVPVYWPVVEHPITEAGLLPFVIVGPPDRAEEAAEVLEGFDEEEGDDIVL